VIGVLYFEAWIPSLFKERSEQGVVWILSPLRFLFCSTYNVPVDVRTFDPLSLLAVNFNMRTFDVSPPNGPLEVNNSNSALDFLCPRGLRI
jgi:hypothetical protein